MKIVVRCALLFTVTLLFGCASGPRYADVAASIAGIEAGQARFYFYRDSIFGGAYQPDVLVNGEKVGAAVPKGVFYRDVPPGNYVVTTTMAQGKDVALNLQSGEVRYIRLAYRFGFNVYPELVENSIGKQEIQGLSYIKP